MDPALKALMTIAVERWSGGSTDCIPLALMVGGRWMRGLAVRPEEFLRQTHPLTRDAIYLAAQAEADIPIGPALAPKVLAEKAHEFIFFMISEGGHGPLLIALECVQGWAVVKDWNQETE